MSRTRVVVHAVVAMLSAILAAAPVAGDEMVMHRPTGVLSLAPDEAKWDFTAQGKYLLVKDPRGLMQVYHPWDISQEGDFASLTARVNVPADWRGPFFINLYANDTYVGDGREQAEQFNAVARALYYVPGHRFKQVWIDNKLVWDQDVADAEEVNYLSLDVSQHVAPGKALTLTLRVVDKVGSGTRLPTDEIYMGIRSGQGLRDPDYASKFYTRVFWGDVALSAGAPVKWEDNPARREVRLNPVRLAAAEPVARAEGALLLNCAQDLPADGCPVTWGIPFGQGRLQKARNVELLDPEGKPVPLQTKVTEDWPDGSVRWLLLDFMAQPRFANREYKVLYGTQVSPAPAVAAGVRVQAADGKMTVDTGALRFTVEEGQTDLLQAITLDGDGEPLGQSLTGEVVTKDGWMYTRFYARAEKWEVESSGPLRATLKCSGHLVSGDSYAGGEKAPASGPARATLVSGDNTFGRFTFRVHAYQGEPYLRVFFRIFNDTDMPAQLVDQLLLRLRTPLVKAEAIIGDQRLNAGAAETARLLVRQQRADGYEVFQGNDSRRAAGEHWTGPITLQSPTRGVSGQVRHFAQQYPKRMWAGYGGQMVFDLFARTIEYEQYVMTRGEAKRHELLLYFHHAEAHQPQAAATFQAFESPPMLTSGPWYAEQQAFGRGAALTPETNELHRRMLEAAPRLECKVPIGLRNWPDRYSDSIYNPYRGTWSNMYQDLNYGAYILGLLGGRRDWLEWAEAIQRHYMDLDVCHYHPDPKFIGLSYGIGAYHTGWEPSPLNAPLAGLFMLHVLTGDRDAYDTAVEVADATARVDATEWTAQSARAYGWPIRALSIAYENTGDEKYRKAARRLIDIALRFTEPRRGYFKDIGGTTWQYRGGLPLYNAIFAAGLMRYWRATGDDEVGRLCANIGYNMAYSWMSPTQPGVVLGCDPLKQVTEDNYVVDILPLWWGYELTGNPALLDHGAQMMRTSILGQEKGGLMLSRYWEMQDTLCYYDLWLQRGQ